MHLGGYTHAINVGTHPQIRTISSIIKKLRKKILTAMLALPNVSGAAGENTQLYIEIHTHPQLVTHWLLAMDQDPVDHRRTQAWGHRWWIIKCACIGVSSRDGGHALLAASQIGVSRRSLTTYMPHM